MQTGLLHVYMGDGKGKTTAAIGLAVRAAGAGKDVIFAQFMKGGDTGELASFEKLAHIRVLRCEKHFPFYSQMSDSDKCQQREMHDKMLDQIAEAVNAGSCDILVLDEVTYPWQWELLDIDKLMELLQAAKNRVEVVCTGRKPDAWLLEQADYITQMQAVRHPYEKGIKARQGIEY